MAVVEKFVAGYKVWMGLGREQMQHWRDFLQGARSEMCFLLCLEMNYM